MIHGRFLYAPLLCFQVGDGYNYGVYDYDVDTSVMKIKNDNNKTGESAVADFLGTNNWLQVADFDGKCFPGPFANMIFLKLGNGFIWNASFRWPNFNRN